MIQSISFCQASSIFARKCISGGESSRILTKRIGNNPHLLEQKVPVFVDFLRFMIESAFPKRNSQKHRLNLLDILGSCSNTTFLVFVRFTIERAFPKRNSQKR